MRSSSGSTSSSDCGRSFCCFGAEKYEIDSKSIGGKCRWAHFGVGAPEEEQQPTVLLRSLPAYRHVRQMDPPESTLVHRAPQQLNRWIEAILLYDEQVHAG